MTASYTFTGQLAWSEGHTTTATVDNVLMAAIPGAKKITKADQSDDRNGTDWWVWRECDRTLSIDAKVRREDWAVKGQDDLALETWSVVERQSIGWTRNRKKKTDFILWLWTDTKRWCLIPFPMLCAVFQEYWEEWRKTYKTRQQYTPDGGYHSECVFVPRTVVWRAIYVRFSGMPDQHVGA